MKIWAAAAVSCSILFASDESARPEPFFSHGNVVSYSTTTYPKAGHGKRNTSELKIVSLSGKGDNLLSEALLSYYNEQHKLTGVYKLSFACDSTCFYVHATNWQYIPADNKFSVYTGDSLWYPYNMKVGDTLPDAWSLRLTESDKLTGQFKKSYTKRKVVALDTLVTPFGQRIAFKIEMILGSDTKFDSDYSGRNKKDKELTVYEWFTPGLGVVRSEYHDDEYGVTKVIMENFKK